MPRKPRTRGKKPKPEITFRYFKKVPKKPYQHVRWRQEVIKECIQSPSTASEILQACDQDPLFWINTFGYVYEPRNRRVLPMNTYDYQDDCIQKMTFNLGKQDVGVEKSRDMGATWMYLYVLDWFYTFREMSAFGLVTRTEDLCDKTGDPDTLMWKLDFIHKWLPDFMAPQQKRSHLKMENIQNGSTVMGYSSTGDVGRGGRKLAFALDEAASFGANEGYEVLSSTQSVTDCRLFVSTPKGNSGMFYDIMNTQGADILKIRIHWSQHPTKGAGYYQGTNRENLDCDPLYKYPANYNFLYDGKLRSPWYDRECRRGLPRQLIAQELDIDYGGSGFPFFEPEKVTQFINKYARKPTTEGVFSYDRFNEFRGTYNEIRQGPLKMWVGLEDGVPPEANYIAGVDIAVGTGGDHASNSVISIGDQLTGRKVAEFASPHITPEEFADFCTALCYWFHRAYLVFEANGPGVQFANKIKKNKYPHVYLRKAFDVRFAKQTEKPGWYSTKESKRMLLGDYQRAMGEEEFVNPSEIALNELNSYVYLATGDIVHGKSSISIDPTGAGQNHGDRVIADALVWHGILERRLARGKKGEGAKDVPPDSGTFAYRRKLREEKAKVTTAEEW